ncbi:MAG TPA: ABC transporter ATP-binding protein, partial [Candidatus Rokubacteria bacterium]|nr:ABC transporter ATP-binding protein [Candidatus Rokubacteria bacterium]
MSEIQPLALSGLSKAFGGLHAVAGVDLSVRPGERRAIIGPNGAGKT